MAYCKEALGLLTGGKGTLEGRVYKKRVRNAEKRDGYLKRMKIKGRGGDLRNIMSRYC
jgi:hypothetical protein